MKEYSEEEIIGMCEAYQVYCMLSEEDKNKIPEEFRNELERVSKNKVGAVIDTPHSITTDKLSREGIKALCYMCLFLK